MKKIEQLRAELRKSDIDSGKIRRLIQEIKQHRSFSGFFQFMLAFVLAVSLVSISYVEIIG